MGTEKAKEFTRAGAKYVCTICKNGYFTRAEVVGCYGGHGGQALRAAESGHALWAEGKIEEAETKFREAIGLNPELVSAKQGVLAVDLTRGKAKPANGKVIADEAEAIEMARVCNVSALALSKVGKFAEAEASYRCAIEILKSRSVVYKLWLNLGICLYRAKKKEQAIESLKKCAAAAPTGYTKAEELLGKIQKNADIDNNQGES